MKKHRIPKIPAIDFGAGRRGRRLLKKAKNRCERRKAKFEPDCVACYGAYNGWLT